MDFFFSLLYSDVCIGDSDVCIGDSDVCIGDSLSPDWIKISSDLFCLLCFILMSIPMGIRQIALCELHFPTTELSFLFSKYL